MLSSTKKFIKDIEDFNIDQALLKLQNCKFFHENIGQFIYDALDEPIIFRNLRNEEVKVMICKYRHTKKYTDLKEIYEYLFANNYNNKVVNSILNHWYQPFIFKYIPTKDDSEPLEVHIALNGDLTKNEFYTKFMILYCLSLIWRGEDDYDMHSYDNEVISAVIPASYVKDIIDFDSNILKDIYIKHFDSLLEEAKKEYEQHKDKTLYKIVKIKVQDKKKKFMPVLRRRVKLLKNIHNTYYKKYLVNELKKM